MGKKRQLEFTNRLMFNRVLCHEEICRGLIRALLGIEVESIRYLNAEQPYEPGSSSRGVRMDIVAKEDGRIYDIEMQVGPEAYIGRRMRYYQAAMDVGELGPGEAWGQLSESHIIFICPSDLLAGGLPVYTINRICIEAPDLDIGDGSHWHVLNAGAWEEASDGEVRAVLEYIRTGNATNALSREIDDLVARYNNDRKWVGRVMLWENEVKMRCRQAEERGREEGRAEGEGRLAVLMMRLISDGRSGDIECVAANREYREKLFKEYGL